MSFHHVFSNISDSLVGKQACHIFLNSGFRVYLNRRLEFDGIATISFLSQPSPSPNLCKIILFDLLRKKKTFLVQNRMNNMSFFCVKIFISLCPDMFDYRSHQMYYMFGFLFLVFIILVITCSEATILLCYFHLCAEVRVSSIQC